MALPKASAPIGRSPSPKRDPGAINRLLDQFQSPPELFFQALLEELILESGVLAGQVWGLNRTAQLAKISTTDAARFQAFEHPEIVEKHRDLISQSLFSGTAHTVSFKESNQHVLSGRLLYFVPLHLEQESVGVVELILEKKLQPADQKKLDKYIAEASRYLATRANQNTDSLPVNNSRLRSTSDEADLDVGQIPTQDATVKTVGPLPDEARQNGGLTPFDIESFVLLLHNQNDLAYVAATSVSETRRLINCDRVSLAAMTNGVTELTAISGQDVVASKSNIVRAMQALAAHVIQSGQEICFELGDESTSTGSFELTAEYLFESGASWLRVIPLFAPEKIDFESDIHESDQTPFAALFIELFSERSTPDPQVIHRLTPHIAQATYHALAQEQVFLLPMRRRIGDWVRKSRLTRSKLTLAFLLTAVMACALTFIQVPYRVQATGRLMPVQQFRAYAPFDGQVQKVWVENGQSVLKNQPLVSVYGESLASRKLTLTNSLVEKKKLLAAFKAQLDETSNQLSQTATISLNTKVVQLSLEIRGLTEQLQLLQQLLDQSHVRSEIDGSIATFRPNDLLNGRPVGRGELLLEVMNEQGPWQLELQLPEKRFGHVIEEFQSKKTDLPVTFMLATTPEQTFEGTVKQVSTRASIAEDGSSAIVILASINEGQALRHTIGAEVIARVQCGDKSLGYVWFGDILDWFRQRAW